MKLANIFQNGAILQRDKAIKIWGWAEPGTPITVTLQHTATTLTRENGSFEAVLPPLPAGGPHTLQVNDIILTDILMGDLWLCAGQSNMELPMTRVKRAYPNEVENTVNPNIRQYLLPVNYRFDKPADDTFGTEWISVDPKHTDRFSATGYFFAQKVHQETGVPIGLVMTAVGGTPIQTWMSEKSLQNHPQALKALEEARQEGHIETTLAADQKRGGHWYETLNRFDQGLAQNWHMPDIDDSQWKTIHLEEKWNHYTQLQQPGAVWLRKEIQLQEGGPGKVDLGTITDADEVYLNGEKIGSTAYQYPPRIYPAAHFKPGKNTLAIRVIAAHQTGGFTFGKDRSLTVHNQKIALDGPWKFRRGVTLPKLEGQTFFHNVATGCYNAMIAPLQKLPINGILWYQGESNAGNPQGYGELLKTLVLDWRSHWGDIPFLTVQLANWVLPGGSLSWAWLRHEQSQVLELPLTGQALAYDAGEPNDLHPLDKKTIGTRLALQALKTAYGKDIIADGPKVSRILRDESAITIHFDEELFADGAVTDIEIEAGDGVIPMETTLTGDTLTLAGPGLSEAAYVRYAWCDNLSGAALYGKTHLPAPPFRIKL